MQPVKLLNNFSELNHMFSLRKKKQLILYLNFYFFIHSKGPSFFLKAISSCYSRMKIDNCYICTQLILILVELQASKYENIILLADKLVKCIDAGF